MPRAYVVKGREGLTEEDVKVNHRSINPLLILSQSHVAAALSPHKHLAGGVEFVAQIPKSAAGKILRKDLVAMYKSRVSGQSSHLPGR